MKLVQKDTKESDLNNNVELPLMLVRPSSKIKCWILSERAFNAEIIHIYIDYAWIEEEQKEIIDNLPELDDYIENFLKKDYKITEKNHHKHLDILNKELRKIVIKKV